jgi:CRP/FNR family transcriptional regulator, cyclic AMP receptor protein
MPLVRDIAVLQGKLDGFPLVTYQAGETVLTAGLRTGRLLILTEPGAVFGELSVLLDQPHTADVRALEVSQFHVADAATLLRIDPIGLLYVATVLARRLESANQALIGLKRQVQTGEPRGMIDRTVEKMELLVGATYPLAPTY